MKPVAPPPPHRRLCGPPSHSVNTHMSRCQALRAHCRRRAHHTTREYHHERRLRHRDAHVQPYATAQATCSRPTVSITHLNHTHQRGRTHAPARTHAQWRARRHRPTITAHARNCSTCAIRATHTRRARLLVANLRWCPCNNQCQPQLYARINILSVYHSQFNNRNAASLARFVYD